MEMLSIYHDLILEHARNTKNSGRIENPDLQAKVFNPLCGDELELTISLNGSTIDDCKTLVRGCSICHASASMMIEIILKKTLNEVEGICVMFFESLQKENGEVSITIDSLRPLVALKNHRSRVKCMKLAWEALEDCTNNSQY